MVVAIRKKVVIVGDAACGKTCLCISISKGHFDDAYIPTVFENYEADVNVNDEEVYFYVNCFSMVNTEGLLFMPPE